MSVRVEHIGDATLYLGDCRDVLPTIGQVDAVVTDPPYFIPAQSYVGARGRGYAKRLIGDISILEGYFESLFSALDANLTPGGTYYVFCDAKSYPVFWKAMFPRCNHLRLLIWDKVVSYNGYTWRHQHELIAWGECEGASRVPTGDGDVLRERGVLQKDRVHPAEKPIGLIYRLCMKLPVGSKILDPFMGSGSAGVAAIESGRRFVGIEIETSYFDIACRRIEEATRQPDMFIPQPPKPVQLTFFEAAE